MYLKWTLPDVFLEIVYFKNSIRKVTIPFCWLDSKRGKYQKGYYIRSCAYHGVRNVVRKFVMLCFFKTMVWIFLFTNDLKRNKAIANIKGTATQLIKQQLNYCVNTNN